MPSLQLSQLRPSTLSLQEHFPVVKWQAVCKDPALEHWQAERHLKVFCVPVFYIGLEWTKSHCEVLLKGVVALQYKGKEDEQTGTRNLQTGQDCPYYTHSELQFNF